MPTIKFFYELEIWKMARTAENKVFQLTNKEKFKKDLRHTGQTNAATGSVMDNIAEGFGRGSRLEFAKSLGISIGEANEVQSQLFRALDRNYIEEKDFNEVFEMYSAIIAKTGKLILYLNKTEKKGVRFTGRKN